MKSLGQLKKIQYVAGPLFIFICNCSIQINSDQNLHLPLPEILKNKLYSGVKVV